MRANFHGRIDGPTIDLRFDDTFRVPNRSLRPLPHTLDIGEEPFHRQNQDYPIKKGRVSSNRRCLPGILYLFTALVCFGACVPLGWALYSIARAVNATERSIDPILQAAMPSVRDASVIMSAAKESTNRIELLLNNTLAATGSVAPAMEKAFTMLNTSNTLVERMTTLVRHPVMRLELEG